MVLKSISPGCGVWAPLMLFSIVKDNFFLALKSFSVGIRLYYWQRTTPLWCHTSTKGRYQVLSLYALLWWVLSLYILKLYIFQPHFTFYSTFRFATLHFTSPLYILQHFTFCGPTDLVTQPFNGYPHRDLQNLNLQAWLLEPPPFRHKGSLTRWQQELRLLKDHQPEPSTI